MSFLSSLFCCFDGEDTAKSRTQHTSTLNKSQANKRPNLTKTQSNLQRALTNNASPTPRSANTRNNSSANLAGLNPSSNIAAANILPSNKQPVKPTQSKMNTRLETSDSDFKETIEEISDTKESANSSKVDDDILIHENHTQNTDDNTNGNGNTFTAQTNGTANGTANGTTTHDNTNPISNLNPNDIHAQSSFGYEDELFNEHFGVDLRQILPDQAVSSSGWLLNTKKPEFKHKKCLVLDLDETLVHSSFKFVRQCDFVIPVEIENQVHNVYVIKRPGVDKFLKRVGELFEVVVFTASVSRYGDPLLDILDSHHKSIHHRLFRDSCYNYQGNYIKNLSQMGRPLEDLIIIDNSPASYVFHPQHAVPISSWFSDSHDCELSDLLPFLEDLATQEVDDVRLVLDINI